jgi:hypothetical protein
MSEPAFRVFHRIVRTDPPTLDDFVSNQAKGKPPPDDPALRAVWDGISVYSTLAQARRKRRASPALGAYIAMLRVPEGGAVRYERTLGEGHHTLRGDPSDILGLVVSVVPA